MICKKTRKKFRLHLILFCFFIGVTLYSLSSQNVYAEQTEYECPKSGYDSLTAEIDEQFSCEFGTDLSTYLTSSATSQEISLVLYPGSPLLQLFGGTMPTRGTTYDISAYMNNSELMGQIGPSGHVYAPCYQGYVGNNSSGSDYESRVGCTLCGSFLYYMIPTYSGTTVIETYKAPAHVLVVPDNYQDCSVYNMTLVRSASAPYTWSLKATANGTPLTNWVDEIRYEFSEQISYTNQSIGSFNPNDQLYGELHVYTETFVKSAVHTYTVEHNHTEEDCEERLHTHALKYDSTKAHVSTCTLGANVYYTGDCNATYYEYCSSCGTLLKTHVLVDTREESRPVGSNPMTGETIYDNIVVGVYDTTVHAEAANHTYTWYESAADSCYTLGNPHSGTLKQNTSSKTYVCQTCGKALFNYNTYTNYSSIDRGNFNLPKVYAQYYEFGYDTLSVNRESSLWKNVVHRTCSGLVCGTMEYGDQICDQIVVNLVPVEPVQKIKAGDEPNTLAYVGFKNGMLAGPVDCQLTGYDPNKYNEWQSVTLSYGNYTSTTNKAPFTVRMSIYVECTSANLVLEVSPEGAGSVAGAGTYPFKTSVTISTVGYYGYTFDGWYNGNTVISESPDHTFEMPSSGLTLTARYIPHKFNLTVKSEYPEMGKIKTSLMGSNAAAVAAITEEASYNSSVTVTAVPASGYTFAGWYDGIEKVSSDASYTFIMPGFAYELEARFTPPYYKVSFNSAGGTSCAAINVQYLGVYGNLPTPERNGYVFLGWTDADGRPVTPTSIVTIMADHVLVAQWADAGPEFIIVGQGDKYGNNNWSNDSTNIGKLGLIQANFGAWLPQPLKYGYAFNAWCRTEDAYGNGAYTVTEDGNIVTKDTVMNLEEEHTLHAGWSPVTPKVTFDTNGGTSCAPQTKTYDRPYGEPDSLPTTTKSGYVFAGWYLTEYNDNGAGEEVTDETYVQNPAEHTLYAKWEEDTGILSPKEVTVTFSGRTKEQIGLTAKQSEAAGYGSTIGAISGTSKYELVYPGTYGGHPTTWCSCTDTGTHSASNGWTAYGNKHYKINTSGSPKYSGFPAAIRTGYIHVTDYWELKDGTQVKNLADLLLKNSSHVLYPHYKAITYNIEIDLYGNISKEDGTSIPAHITGAPPLFAEFDKSFEVGTPEREGYTFLGWNITGMDHVTHYYGDKTATTQNLYNVTETVFRNLRSDNAEPVKFSAQWEATESPVISDFRIIDTDDLAAKEILQNGCQALTLKKGYNFFYEFCMEQQEETELPEVKITPRYLWESYDAKERMEVKLYGVRDIIVTQSGEWGEEPWVEYKGKGRIPVKVFCVPMNLVEEYEAYVKRNTISGREYFFKRDGYVILQFEIQFRHSQGEWISYAAWEKTELAKDALEQGWHYVPGDVIRYDLSKSIKEDYELGGVE